jgi:phosphate/sulfate permease
MEMLYGTVAATVLWVWLAQRLRSPVSISYTFVVALLGSALGYGVNDADRIPDAADIMRNIIIKDM